MLQLEIKLKDPEPVARTYMSVPKPLYDEMKNYITDLIAKGWIEKSHIIRFTYCLRQKEMWLSTPVYRLQGIKP